MEPSYVYCFFLCLAHLQDALLAVGVLRQPDPQLVRARGEVREVVAAPKVGQNRKLVPVTTTRQGERDSNHLTP